MTPSCPNRNFVLSVFETENESMLHVDVWFNHFEIKLNELATFCILCSMYCLLQSVVMFGGQSRPGPAGEAYSSSQILLS